MLGVGTDQKTRKWKGPHSGPVCKAHYDPETPAGSLLSPFHLCSRGGGRPPQWLKEGGRRDEKHAPGEEGKCADGPVSTRPASLTCGRLQPRDPVSYYPHLCHSHPLSREWPEISLATNGISKHDEIHPVTSHKPGRYMCPFGCKIPSLAGLEEEPVRAASRPHREGEGGAGPWAPGPQETANSATSIEGKPSPVEPHVTQQLWQTPRLQP